MFFISCGGNNSESNTNISDSTAKSDNASELTPANPKSGWDKEMKDPMAVVIEKLKSYNAPPLT